MTRRRGDPPPRFPAHVLAEVVPEIMRAKNTIPHHDAQRLAPPLIAAALNAAGSSLTDAELRPFGLRRLQP